VREYLYLEFKDMRLPFPFDIERIIDDFVLMCFFVGNDFLPHMPALEIREGAIDALMAIYKQQLPALGDYLTANGRIDFNRVDLIFNDLAKIEEELIRSKRAFEDRMKAQEGAPQKRIKTGINRESVVTAATNEEEPDKSPGITAEEEKERALKEIEDLQAEVTEEELNKRAAQTMKDIAARVLKEKEKQIADKYVDKVQLGVDGWKLRYYTEKFHVSQGDVQEFM
jgi:5'-3' exoribonuclease 2